MATFPFLKFGNTGNSVEGLQKRLLRLGFNPGPLDGDFGQKTEAAVKDFQRKHGLEIDGKVGPLTWAAIVAAENGSEPATSTPFGAKLITVAVDQFDTFHLRNEGDTRLCRQIKRYWDDLGLGFTSCTAVPWSAVFVSWCVKRAGATAEQFKFSAAHSQFVHAAIKNADNDRGVFHGLKFNSTPLQVGDILQNNRGGAERDFEFARTHSAYESHSAIVVQVSLIGANSFAVIIGGNEGDSIRRTMVDLNSSGVVKQRANNPFISIVRKVA